MNRTPSARSLAQGVHRGVRDQTPVGHLKDWAVESRVERHRDAFEAAIVAVPSRVHASVCIDLLRAGKRVMVEKPMATTLEDADAIVAAAEAAPGTLSVVHWRRYRHLSTWTKAILDSGTLGRIESFDFREGAVFNWPATTDSFWRPATSGGGVFADQGAHLLDLLLCCLGDFDSLRYRDDSQGGVEADRRPEVALKSGAEGTVEPRRTRNIRASAAIRGIEGWVEGAMLTSRYPNWAFVDPGASRQDMTPD